MNAGSNTESVLNVMGMNNRNTTTITRYGVLFQTSMRLTFWLLIQTYDQQPSIFMNIFLTNTLAVLVFGRRRKGKVLLS